ncbi:MAG: hypothetical protein EP343_33140 [Deltaproteobacteria bacterium]|nr:MAG: hypothetical protein EP343_33140 [Deltaproteobacteria bacterium]
MLRIALFLFLVGGTIISLGDRFHIVFGVLSQNDQSFLGQAWWVPLVFGVAGLLMFPSWVILRKVFRGVVYPIRISGLIGSTILFLIAYAATGPFAKYAYIMTGILVGAWIVRLWWRTQTDVATVVFCLLLAIAGPLVEIGFSAAGMFEYHVHHMWSIPMWLPGIYLHGALVLVDLEGFFVEIGWISREV